MEDPNLLDSGFIEGEEKEIISSNNFVILYFVTFGIYGIWWMYKSWRFFQRRDNLDIMPALRAIFYIFFLYGLLERIQAFAHAKGYSNSYNSLVLFVGFILLNLLARLPDPMWVISILAFVCLIPPFNALNYAMIHSEDIRAREQEGFNQRQLVLVILGIFMWFLVVIGLVFGE